MNLVSKSLFFILLLSFTFNGYSDASNFEVGDVFESKKRSTSVLLYKSKLDLHQRVRVPNAATGAHTLIYSKYTYTLQKGDKIILLGSLEERGRQFYRVALVPKRKAKYLDNPYFYVVPDNFNQLVFLEHLTE
tara:strand:- start:576 stop:974 length:399 start_codon:yes stop_codon:yes gene_type:complete